MNILCFLVIWLLHIISNQKSLAWVPPYLRPYLDRSLSLPLSLNPPCCNTSPLRPSEILPRARYQNGRLGEGTEDYITMQSENDGQNKRNTRKLLREMMGLTNGNVNKRGSRSKLEKYSNGGMPIQIEPKNDGDEKRDDNIALKCSRLQCVEEDTKGPVCACNFKTGNTVSFKNECDIKKHNCRFDTEFRTILHEVCPWQFESRSGSDDADEESIM